MKLVALATAVSCCLTGCSFTGDGILGKDKKGYEHSKYSYNG